MRSPRLIVPLLLGWSALGACHGEGNVHWKACVSNYPGGCSCGTCPKPKHDPVPAVLAPAWAGAWERLGDAPFPFPRWLVLDETGGIATDPEGAWSTSAVDADRVELLDPRGATVVAAATAGWLVLTAAAGPTSLEVLYAPSSPGGSTRDPRIAWSDPAR